MDTFKKHTSALLSMLLLLILSAVGAQAQTYDLVVAKDGTGNYTTVQAAVNAAPTGRTTPFTIYIKNGKYKEKISVPSNKPFLHFIGQSVANTILTFDDYSGKPNPAGGTFGTSNSASVTISAPDFAAFNITFENTTGDSPQALAINVSSDRVVFKNCRFLGGQDTVLANGANARQYFRNCYIDGTVDFVFGNARGVFERCIVYPKTRLDGGATGYITAANTPAGQAYGYVFRNCTIPANRGLTSYFLGRPWQNSGTPNPNPAENKVVWLNARMGAGIVKPAGWSTWDAGTVTSVITYAEFRSRDLRGNLVNVSQRVPWSIQLTPADTAQYQVSNVFGTWNPCAVATGVCGSFAPDIAVSNFRAVKGTSTAPSQLSWNLSWAIPQVQFELFRSSTRRGTYTSINTQTAPNDTTYNFGATDPIPPAGQAYYYYVRASKAGMAAHITDTLQISSAPTINITGAPGTFAQYLNGPSGTQSYLVSGVNLTSGISITPPAGYEISANGTNWFSSTATLTLPATNNTVASTTISVRLNAGAAGPYAGDIVHTSTGAPTVNVPVTGTKFNTQPVVSAPLQWWPMTLGNQDSTQVRSAQVLPSVPTFRKFVISSGSAAATIPPYSSRYGQAFAPVADGAWTTALGGNGGNLNRTYYEQFTVTAAAGATSVRLDSLLLTSYVTGSTSNTKLAVVWSRSGFASDSADVSGGRNSAGPLLSTANGGFLTPILLTTQQVYRLAFAGATGLTLAPGQRLTFRLYYSCGSTTVTTRFATLKNVVVKGEALTGAATASAAVLKGALQAYPNPAAEQLTVEHPRASQGAKVTVYGFDGRRLGSFPSQLGSTHTSLPLSQLAPGNYLLLYSGDGVRLSTTVTKQ